MCIRNGIRYDCPDGHVLLDPVRPFSFCFRSRRGPISRQCDIIVNSITMSDEWCIDCWMHGEEARRSVKWELDGNSRGNKHEANHASKSPTNK